jgi:hypothetical protein
VVRIPWVFHEQAGARQPRGIRYRRPASVSPLAFTRQLQGVPLTGGQARGVIGAGGGATISIGPQGLGTIWYPVMCTISTTTGALDISTCAVYLGSQAQQNLQGGQSYAGGGDVVALSVSSMTAGDLLIAVWSGGNPGDIAVINITGTMDALAY